MKFSLFAGSLGCALIALSSPAPAADKAEMHQGAHHEMSQNSAEIGDIMIMNAWAREGTKSARTGAVYLTLMNAGASADTLVSVASPVAEKSELHTNIMAEGVMKMRPVEGIEVPAGEAVELARGGLHIMLIGLREQLVEGASFPLTLTFENAGQTSITVPIQDIAYKASGEGPAHKHGQQNQRGVTGPSACHALLLQL